MQEVGDQFAAGATLPFEIQLDDFSRRFSMRHGNLMWFLGAGASAAAGIPTAGDMIWEFKQKLFVSQRRASPEMVADLSAPGVRQHLQAHIDSSNSLPAEGAPDEYSALFEAVFPAEADRRTYLDAKLSGAKPSYGHMALASLMKSGHTRVVWTTNFDPLIADACAKVFDGTGALTSLAFGIGPAIARQAMVDGRWPIEVKLHGDFRWRRLKNTPDELRHQDKELRAVLVDSCRTSGLVVCGYSGRDDSVMDTLEEAVALPGAFPAGLFWLHRGDGEPYQRVSALLARADANGIETGLVRVQSFDEGLRDLARMVADLDMKSLDSFGKQREPRSPAPAIVGKSHWPVLRINALRVTQTPTVCRRVVCAVGGFAEARDAVELAGVDVLTTRTRSGVLAFGNDADIRKAFEPFNITEFDLATIELRRLRYDSSERGLLREAVGRALCRDRGLNRIRKRTADLLYPIAVDIPRLQPLKSLVPGLGGSVPGFPDLEWREGCAVRFEWAADALWLLLEPSPVFLNITLENKAAAADFGRRRTFNRYNQKLDALIGFWSDYIFGDGEEIYALGATTGVDASFRFGQRNAYSRRAAA
ncbi:SIR2 family protein [Variovorax sp. YR216]|uniref:SIR2 family protein n=1 Tax=Variovorax sp. YR216 TaxID=1882828 RepID=UPI0008987D09|nr:SIR2 family protein [Variovorax sp. YR216]SEA86710.1 SIR2-like domain-containing protein [Variovorax sp. YR216]